MVSNQEDDNLSEDKNLVSVQPSKEFFKLVEQFAQSFDKPKEIYKKIAELGRKEGFNDIEIDIMINSYLKGRVARKTLYNYTKEFLPLAIQDKKVGKNTHIDDKNLGEKSSRTIYSATETNVPEQSSSEPEIITEPEPEQQTEEIERLKIETETQTEEIEGLKETISGLEKQLISKIEAKEQVQEQIKEIRYKKGLQAKTFVQFFIAPKRLELLHAAGIHDLVIDLATKKPRFEK